MSLNLFYHCLSYFGIQNMHHIDMPQRYVLAVWVLSNLRTSKAENSKDQGWVAKITFILFFWDVTSGDQLFEVLYCLQIQGNIWYPPTRRYVCGTAILTARVWKMLTAES